MHRIARLAVVLLAAASAAFAQAPTQQGAGVELSTSYLKFTNGSQATLLAASKQVSPHWYLSYAQVQAPDSKAQFFLAGGKYDTTFAHIFRKAAAASAGYANLDNVHLGIGAGLGTRRDDAGNHPGFAYGFLGYIAVPVGKVAGAGIAFKVEAGMIGGKQNNPAIQAPGHFFLLSNSEPVIAPGVTFRF